MAGQFKARITEFTAAGSSVGVGSLSEHATALEAAARRLDEAAKRWDGRCRADATLDSDPTDLLNTCIKRLSRVLLPIASTFKGTYGHDTFSFTHQSTVIPCLFDVPKLARMASSGSPSSCEVRKYIWERIGPLSAARCAFSIFESRPDPWIGGLIETADHVEKRLTLLARHHGTGALERAGQCGGIFDALAIAARRDADLLECREAIEAHERRLVALGGAAARVHRGREMAHGIPHRIVHDDEENRQLVQGSSMVDGDWVAEEIGAIADDGDDRSLGSRELGAKRGARAPAQARGGARAEVAVGVLESAMSQAERILVDDDRSWILCLMQAVADPGRMDWAAR